MFITSQIYYFFIMVFHAWLIITFFLKAILVDQIHSYPRKKVCLQWTSQYLTYYCGKGHDLVYYLFSVFLFLSVYFSFFFIGQVKPLQAHEGFMQFISKTIFKQTFGLQENNFITWQFLKCSRDLHILHFFPFFFLMR